MPDMEAALNTIRAKARHLAKVAEECRVRPGPMATSVAGTLKGDGNIFAEGGRSAVEEYAEKFTGDFMEVVRNWADGVNFAQLLLMSKIFAGSVIRCLRRLDELLKQMHSAAKVAGNVDLEIKFTTANTLIKRDIVFAGSLYL
ncbi:unnamed protein product [Rodentolepis nana]|uniref:ATP-dependent RNA helicase Ski2/MTR4 C-terminal domain-containing protein n=1 Tax=Rodentolepis nana TaxID=102285 RepID=A0A3P7SA06_RODNA|nr:unnamed protein product [Rodentolepis nana]